MALGWAEVFRRIIGFGEVLQEGNENLADFIQNGPSDGIRGAVRDVYRRRCEEFTNVPGWAEAINPLTFNAVATQCQPYLSDNSYDLPVRGPGFSGGQCDTTYLVTLQATRGNGTVDPPFTRPAFGPIGAARFVGSPAVGELFCSAINASVSTCASLSAGTPGYRAVGLGGSAYDGGNLAVLSVSRCDSQPDDCGDPDDIMPGPNPAPDPGPLPYDEPTDNPEDPFDPIVPVPPYDDPIVGPIDIDVTAPTPGSFDPSQVPGDLDTALGGPESYGEPVVVNPAPADGQDTFLGPAPEGRVWIGAIVQFFVPTAYGGIAGSGPANTVYPRAIGNVSLRYPSGRSIAQRVQSRWHVIIRESGALRVDAVYLNVLPGIGYQIRGISVPKCPDNECSAPQEV